MLSKNFVHQALGNPNSLQIKVAIVKTIFIDVALTAFYTHDPVLSVAVIPRAFSSYLVRNMYPDSPVLACMVGAGKYGLAGKSSAAGCINHALYNHFDLSPITGDFAYTATVEGLDVVANTYFMNKTIDSEVYIAAAKVAANSGIILCGAVLPVLAYFVPAEGALQPTIANMVSTAAKITASSVAVLGVINFEIVAEEILDMVNNPNQYIEYAQNQIAELTGMLGFSNPTTVNEL